jgi:hypothetical protein
MATDKHKKGKGPVSDAHDQAERDMEKDPEMSDSDPTDDLDEGELARRDNSAEDALDNLERGRQGGRPEHGGHSGQARHEGQSGKGKEK